MSTISSLYIHIPFCKKKCSYCDFVSYAGKEELIEAYVDALKRELENLLKTHNLQLSTIYFGGGTPTLLEPQHFEVILNATAIFMVARNKLEITIEANPGTADKAKLKELRKLGINRLSIGVQSFNDKHLRMLGRIHSSSEAIQFYENARAAGFENINLDLIFSLPDQTFDEWKTDLETALNLIPNHFSTYNLQIEENTPLWEIINSAPKLQLPCEETELAMYEYAIETLTAKGYIHYEISNFSKPGFECQHNINYWKNGNYLGLGAGAHSHVNGKRWANPDSVEEYISIWKLVKNRDPDFTSKFIRRFPSHPSQETIFLGLRLLEGLPADKFIGFEKEINELMNDKLIERKNGRYKLTRRGLYLANLVLEKFV